MFYQALSAAAYLKHKDKTYQTSPFSVRVVYSSASVLNHSTLSKPCFSPRADSELMFLCTAVVQQTGLCLVQSICSTLRVSKTCMYVHLNKQNPKKKMESDFFYNNIIGSTAFIKKKKAWPKTAHVSSNIIALITQNVVWL